MRIKGCLAVLILSWCANQGAQYAKSWASANSLSVSAHGGPVFGNFDGDSDVDLYDYFTFSICQDTSGPAVIASPGCLVLDSDADSDVDLEDAAAFQNSFTGTILPVCGNGKLEAGEQCDDNNLEVADGCSATCTIEPPNDYCVNPIDVVEGQLEISNVGATTDGRDEPLDCNYFGDTQVRSDVWYCYTATCTGSVNVSLCGSAYDTKMAVYNGCQCPSARPLACSDDHCGIGVGNDQSRVTVNVVSGQSYMIRVGGYFGNREQGSGLLTIRCGAGTCGASGSCGAGHGANEPGCEDSACCERVCEVDAFCCDVTWDDFCAGQAAGFCSSDGFPTCNPKAGLCDRNHNSGGCNIPDCCNAVCQTNPACCIDRWDNACLAQAEVICTNCGENRGSCHEARMTPGCEDIRCCGNLCAIDPFCCTTEWDQACVQQAETICD